MKKIIFAMGLIFITSIVYFYFGYLYAEKKLHSQIIVLKENNKSLSEQINDLENNKKSDDSKEYKHPIDIEEQKCIASSHVYDYPACSQKAEKAWDNEIQNNLKLLKKVMTDDEYKYIETMNENWEKSVHNEIVVIDRFISDKDGIIYQTEGSNDISNLKKQYAMLLESIYFHYNEEKEGIF